MGNKQNSESENFKENLSNFMRDKMEAIKKNSYIELDTKATSSYSGIRTSINENNYSLYEDRIHSLSSSQEKLNAEELSTNVNENEDVSIIFEWKEPASTVYLIGSFGNWKQRFFMDKYGDSFRIILVIFLFLFSYFISIFY